ncbi:Rrf2 family transcriptional regulator [Intestinimonas sp. MSJ-38]|uniref:RrF2 family transcriptional regulator n=1 Tax=Intestinimonas sp. MSJ-38 TaxID=2841532 RepID=UPI001C0FB883|nr:Rrf2 family transcriptional regulator [Intestinimonas sp. MSJ-38]MBU5431422.1 Rrf2 family transcriptional regulator [Intestinimonas sp. MSJ-38]
MQLKVSTDYAIRIVLHLAVKGGAATSSEISGQMGIPRSVIATLAKPLQKAGILTTQRGTGGGFALGRRPEDISLHEIVNLMEGTTRINRCLEPDGFCSRKGTVSCSVHRFFLREQEKLERSFREMTIAKLLSDE